MGQFSFLLFTVNVDMNVMELSNRNRSYRVTVLVILVITCVTLYMSVL